MMVVAAMIISLGQLGPERADSRARRSPDNGSLESAAENCTQGRTTRASDKRSFTWTDAAAVMVMAAFVPLNVTPIVSSADMTIHAAVVVAMVLVASAVALIIAAILAIAAVVISAAVALGETWHDDAQQ
jgi:hypothetical protein